MTADPFVQIVEVDRLIDEAPALWRTQASTGALVLRPQGPPASEHELEALARAIGNPMAPVVGLPGRARRMFHSVTPAAGVHQDDRGVIIPSSTYNEIPLHTDGYNSNPPPRTVILQTVTAGTGGESIAIPCDRLVADLRPATIRSLASAVFPTRNEPTPLIWSEDGVWCARINLYEINEHLRRGRGEGRLRPSDVEALSELAELLDREVSRSEYRFCLLSGDLLFLNNRTVLHARTALLPSDNGRLLRRVWLS